MGIEASQRLRFQAAAASVLINANASEIEETTRLLARSTKESIKFRSAALLAAAIHRTPFEDQLRQRQPEKFSILQQQRRQMLELDAQLRHVILK
jgi:hypothetical protein